MFIGNIISGVENNAGYLEAILLTLPNSLESVRVPKFKTPVRHILDNLVYTIDFPTQDCKEWPIESLNAR
jgi:hypothetical protein